MVNIKIWGRSAALCLAASFFAACELPKGDPAVEFTSAIRSNDVLRVRQMLAGGISPNASAEGGGWTPLMTAVMQDNEEMVDLLLKSGADMYARTRNLQTPLHLAARWGKTKATGCLLKYRASPEMLDELGWTPLMWASMRNKLGPAEKLLKAGARINNIDSDGNTPLILSVWRGHRDMSMLLLSHGADPRVKNRDGLDAAGVADKNGFAALAAEIRAREKKTSR
jgi:ankyrin repeat protein